MIHYDLLTKLLFKKPKGKKYTIDNQLLKKLPFVAIGQKVNNRQQIIHK